MKTIELKVSRYCFPFTRENKYYLYSTRVNGVYEISERMYDFLHTNKNSNISELPDWLFPLLDTLEERQILCLPENEREFVREMKINNLQRIYQNLHLSLTILTTELCNLRCPYCFEENKQSHIMDSNTIDSLIDFIKKRGTKTFSVTWFGGEPLLALPQIAELLNKFKELEEPKFISHSIISNGTLITTSAIDLFKKFPLSQIQITLDGNRATHDSKRYNSKGEGTFDLIMSNIEKLVKEIPDISISVRINVDRNNSHQYKEVVDLLKTKFSNYRVYPYPGILHAAGDCNNDDFFSNEEKNIFNNKIVKEGLKEEGQLSFQSKGCIATSSHGYVVGADGSLYRCWEDIGNNELIVGNINNEIFKNTKLITSYLLDADPFEDEECIECGLLPICNTGCPKQRINSKGRHRKEFCSRYSINNYEALHEAVFINFIKSKKSNTRVDK